MIGKMLGFLDIAAAIIIILAQYSMVPYQIVVSFALYLILKGAIFFGDSLSMIDGVVGIYLLLTFFFHIGWLSWICAIYLFIKGGISLM